ncbi:unnamed protein product [Effrenium voratum]|nr:unnamed protein product [Effrenium voratum]
MPETMEISDAAKSGDGSTQNGERESSAEVGIKVDAKFQCAECRQKFDSEKAKQLHWKFIHDPNRHQEDADCRLSLAQRHGPLMLATPPLGGCCRLWFSEGLLCRRAPVWEGY